MICVICECHRRYLSNIKVFRVPCWPTRTRRLFCCALCVLITVVVSIKFSVCPTVLFCVEFLLFPFSCCFCLRRKVTNFSLFFYLQVSSGTGVKRVGSEAELKSGEMCGQSWRRSDLRRDGVGNNYCVFVVFSFASASFLFANFVSISGFTLVRKYKVGQNVGGLWMPEFDLWPRKLGDYSSEHFSHEMQVCKGKPPK